MPAVALCSQRAGWLRHTHANRNRLSQRISDIAASRRKRRTYRATRPSCISTCMAQASTGGCVTTSMVACAARKETTTSQVSWSIAARFNHDGILFDKGGEALIVKVRGCVLLRSPSRLPGGASFQEQQGTDHPSSTVSGHFQPSPEFRVYINQALT